MAITYALGANPIWYNVDVNGEPLAGGTIEFFSQENF